MGVCATCCSQREKNEKGASSEPYELQFLASNILTYISLLKCAASVYKTNSLLNPKPSKKPSPWKQKQILE